MSTQNKTKSASAPLGMAAVFLAVAFLPISLRIAGCDLRLSPRIAAVVRAWEQMAGALGNGNQPAIAEQLARLYATDSGPTQSSEQSGAEEANALASLAADAGPAECPTNFSLSPDVQSRDSAAAIAVAPATADSAAAAPESASPVVGNSPQPGSPQSPSTMTGKVCDAPRLAVRRQPQGAPALSVAARDAALAIVHRACPDAAAAQREAARRAIAIKAMEAQMSQLTIELNKTMRNLPEPTNVKLMLDVRPLRIPACNVRVSFPPKPDKGSLERLRRSAIYKAPADSQESSEF